MDRAANRELGQVAERQRLVGCSLPAECGIAVNLNIQDLSRIVTFSHIVQLRPRFAHRYSVLALKMTRIVYHGERDSLPVTFC